MNACPTRPAASLLPVLLALTLLVTLVAAPSAAQAASSSTYRVTGESASTSWTQVDGTEPGTSPVGNVHAGWLHVDQTSRGGAAVFGFIDDFDCPDGALPYEGGHEESDCSYIGSRFIEAFDVPFTLNRKLTTATLKGQLTVYGGGHGGHGDEGGGEVVGRPMADIVWTGFGPSSKSRYSSFWQEGSTTYREEYTATGRAATMSGTLGPMGFDPDLSSGWMGRYKSSSRTRTR